MLNHIVTDKHYQLALSLVPGVGCSWFKKWLAHFGSAQAVFEAAYRGSRLIPPKMAHHMVAGDMLAKAEICMGLHEDSDIKIITMVEDDYPKRLLELPDAPPILYYKGKALLNHQRVVSMVGTRQLTTYGQKAITAFLEQLLPYQPLIVSGLAYGTDVWVHRQALTMGLPTIAVLPTSLNTIYPAVHTQIAMKMCTQNGGVLTEYPIGTKLGAYAFVARNRIVAGLADLTIVIEAKEKSGALITAYYANNYHREVFALPGSIHLPTSAGCHQLIKRHQAHLLTHIDDIAYSMNWQVEMPCKLSKDMYAKHPLSPSEQVVLDQFQYTTEPIALDALIVATALPLGELQAALLSLELQGLLQPLPGKYFVLPQ